MQINQTAEQQNDCLDLLPEEAGAVRDARAEAAGAAKAHSFTNFVHRASSVRDKNLQHSD